MKCSKCQFENLPTAKVCSNCGTPLPFQADDDNGSTKVISRRQLRYAHDTARHSDEAPPPEAAQPANQPPAPPEAGKDRRVPSRRSPQPPSLQDTVLYKRDAACAIEPTPAELCRPAPHNMHGRQEYAQQTAAHEPQDPAAAHERRAAKAPSARSAAQRSARRRPKAAGRRPVSRSARPSYSDRDIEAAEVEALFRGEHPAKSQKNTPMIIGICILSLMALVMLLISFMTFTATGQRWKASMGMNAPAPIYWQLGDTASAAGSMADAVRYYESALRRDPDNYEGTLKLAEALRQSGNSERAERAYRKAISLNPAQTLPYDNLIQLMAAHNAPESELADIAKLAYQNTGNDNYNALLLTYGPSAVKFDPPEGTYSYAVKLQMASDEGAAIYYTTDGTQPTIYSSRYVLPIELGEGEFTVRAISYIDDLCSGETRSTYAIRFPTVPAPQFNSKPGKYSAADNGRKLIKVTVPENCKVYYTADGSAPNSDSRRYKADGIALSPGTHKLRMIAIDPNGQQSSEASAEYEIIDVLKEPFSDNDSFKSFFVDVTTQNDVNKQFKKLLDTTGDVNIFFTQHYSFGEVDFTVKSGVPLVTAVRITNNDITGVRGTKVGWSAEDVIGKFRDEKNPLRNGERVLYTMDHDRYGWAEYDADGSMTSINYIYTRKARQLVELHYKIEAEKVSAIEYCISDM